MVVARLFSRVGNLEVLEHREEKKGFLLIPSSLKKQFKFTTGVFPLTSAHLPTESAMSLLPCLLSLISTQSKSVVGI